MVALILLVAASGVTPDLGQRDPRRWQFLGVLLAGCFMAILDVFIVNVAAPNIQDRLDTDAGTLELIVAGYTLAYAMMLITGARLGDDHGHRRYFLFGVALFTVASAICGAAPTSTVLIVARVMQGIAAGLLVPQVLSIIQVRFAGNERTRAFGIYGLVLGLASVAGQIIGGLLLVWNPFDLGWRVVFLVNVPIGLATLVLGARFIPESRADEPRAVDPVGIALLSAGVLALVYPLIRGGRRGGRRGCGPARCRRRAPRPVRRRRAVPHHAPVVHPASTSRSSRATISAGVWPASSSSSAAPRPCSSS